MVVKSRYLIAGVLSAVPLCGQSFRIPPSGTDRKTPGAFPMEIDSPQGKAPVALQWELRVPAALAIAVSDITIGKAAEAAGKSVACAASANKPAKEGEVRYTCILAGGTQRIPNGQVAVVHYRVQDKVDKTSIRVAIENAVGVSLDLKSVAIDGAIAVIKIR